MMWIYNNNKKKNKIMGAKRWPWIDWAIGVEKLLEG
jgi:hypothetical protein